MDQPLPAPQQRPWRVLAVLCLSVLLVGMDNTIVNVALPTLAAELSADTSGLQWVVDGYTLVFAALLLVGGYLGDRLRPTAHAAARAWSCTASPRCSPRSRDTTAELSPRGRSWAPPPR